MRLNIQELSGNTFSVDVDGIYETIEILKLRIFAAKDFPPCDQYLVYKNEILKDEQTLLFYGIDIGSKVNLVINHTNEQIDSPEQALQQGLPDGNKIQTENQQKSNKRNKSSLQTRKAKLNKKNPDDPFNIQLEILPIGQQMHFKVFPSNQIQEVVDRILVRKEKFTINMIFNGRRMRLEKTFAESGVKDGDKLSMMIVGFRT
ncbi:MAG: hypothetical protein EZS28_044918 [Streblomastix strix]|uniref:Ubiquitin-like domain-containing protein n=1 Tax=Streblomastix strix TaxID=222440 RepID=A0A5J4TQ80_9EUKA|nr:MAG: hypothetical protein EZS28_044918 [Streblomastix strix]